MAEKTVTQIEVDKKLWENFKECAKKHGIILMTFLEITLQEKINNKK